VENLKMIIHKIHKADDSIVSFSSITLEKIQELLKRYPEGQQKSALLPVLHIVQEESGGRLSVNVMNFVASLLEIQPIEVYEVASFYSMFNLDPVGKYSIEVCRTGPCAFCGGEPLIDYIKKKLDVEIGETTADGLFTLRAVECLGACGAAPVAQVNNEFHEFLTPEKIDLLIEQLRKKAKEEKYSDSKWVENFF
jgi:NADH-quinone oxidoreductase subunit E